jgi:hypothetical protein
MTLIDPLTARVRVVSRTYRARLRGFTPSPRETVVSRTQYARPRGITLTLCHNGIFFCHFLIDVHINVKSVKKYIYIFFLFY